MKKGFLLLVMCLLAFSPVWSQNDEEEGFSGGHDEPSGVNINGLTYFFYSNSGKANVRRDNCWDGELVIPAEVEHNGTMYRVSGISWKAFRNCQTLTKVTLPKTLTYLFHYWSYDDFSQYWVPFVGCTALESIEVADDNPCFCSVDGVMFSKDKTDLVCYPIGSKRKTYTVPDGVKRIYEDAFSYNSNLVSVVFPNTVTEMYASFQKCTALESVTLPNSLSVIPQKLFSGCTNLKNIEIPSGITEVGQSAFEHCSSLSTVELPYSVERIGNLAFYNCNNLKSLVIRGHLEERYVNKARFYYIPEQVIIYAQSEQVELIKKYFRGKVLPLELYDQNSTGIDHVDACLKTEKYIPLHDLQGRRVSHPQRGAYIRDGRKVVVK